MKNSLVILFGLRLFLYFSVITLIFIHPGIAVSFDKTGMVLWLLIIPALAAITFFHSSLKKLWIKIAALEPFFLAWVCLRLLSLSRSGEEIAEQNIMLTQFIFIWTAVVFLLHSAVIYLCIFPNSRIKIWKEGTAFLLTASAVFFILLVVLPPDFVRNTVIENLVTERIPQIIRPSDLERGLPQRGNSRRTRPGGREGQGVLRGLPGDDWSDGGGRDNRQYMIKIVASETEPVYMGESFRGFLDPVKGFQADLTDPLNDLARRRLFVSWSSNEFNFDMGRNNLEVFSLSTLQQKFFPYRPVTIDPVILSEGTGPLRFIHQAVSSVHKDDPLKLIHTPTRHFYDYEKRELAKYLDISLEESDKNEFMVYIRNALETWRRNRNSIIREDDSYLQSIFMEGDGGNEYLETILALMTSFSSYQYNLNPDDFSIASIKDFLFDSKEGDCVEFSSALALLGRLSGIPSRIVTGYLAAEGLQTEAHLRGLAIMRNSLPILQQFPFDHLFMVTNLHSHSWTQFYIPDYGWLDFEATLFSIPPQGMGDFNNWDVVIPILDGERTISNARAFPWQAVGRAVITLILIAVLGAYIFRYGREFILYLGAKRGGRAGARYLYLLLLARLAADGKPIKPVSKTAHEYIKLFPDKIESNEYFLRFADIYSEMRWRQFDNHNELETRFLLLKDEYNKILTISRRRGLHWQVVRLFNLRGLAYL
ncbi:MAG: transglutaminase-like domain-containing protein [Treponema sp.]|nr:transglutaminase-like domain-containing protein [Treponema sp.]